MLEKEPQIELEEKKEPLVLTRENIYRDRNKKSTDSSKFFELNSEHLPIKEDVLKFIDEIRKDYQLKNCPKGREPYNCLGNLKIADKFLGEVWSSKEAKANPRDLYTGHYVSLVEVRNQGLCLVDIASHNPCLIIPPKLKNLPYEEMLKSITGYGEWRLVESRKPE